MWKFVTILVAGLALAVPAVTTTENPDGLNSSVLLHRSIQTSSEKDLDGGGRGNVEGRSFVDSPVEWTMSKANLVAEFFTREPAPQPEQKDSVGEQRSQKSLFSFFGNIKNETRGGMHNVKRSNSEKEAMTRGAPYPPPPPPGNLIASGSNFNGLAAIPHPEINRISNNGNGFRFPPSGGGYSTPFRPIIKFPQQNFVLSQGSPESGYPKNLRPPRGPPPPPPPQQFYGLPKPTMTRPINGLRPPPGPPMGPPPRPSSLYLPPQHGNNQQQSHNAPQPQQRPQMVLTLPNQEPRQPQSQSQSFQQPESQYLPPSPTQNNSVFEPSQEYLPQQKPDQQQHQQQQFPQSHFRPGPPPPQILDTHRNQAVYPAPAPPSQTENKPLVYVTANVSDSIQVQSPSPNQQPSSNSYTNYENEYISPPHPYNPTEQPPPSSSSSSAYPQQSTNAYQYPSSPPPANSQQSTSRNPYKPPSPPQNLAPTVNLNELALTEPLSQVLADANAKAGGGAMEKTIRFVIHKPEDEDIVRNAILEDSQNRYEDVRFVQGPTLKVQRKETVYLPPKRKTVVYILLKEPQIDTDVQVMTPQEEEPAPEVYITYQKSDGAVKTKHYSPKPIRQEDMKKYLDIEEDSAYGAPEESRIHPRFSKSTSVSLSTSAKVSRTTTSTSKSSSFDSTEVMEDNNNANNPNGSSLFLANHKMPLNDSGHNAPKLLKPSPLLYSSFTSSSISTSDSSKNRVNNSSRSSDNNNNNATNSLINYRAKKGRSSSSPSSSASRVRPIFVSPSPRRVMRNPIHCPTTTAVVT